MLAPSPRRTLALLMIVAVSTPLALGVETAARKLMFPAEFEEVRAFLRPMVTPYTWVAPILAIPMTGLGFVIQRRRIRANVARLGLDRARFDALFLASSAPQIPALLATFAFTIGAGLAPVVAAIVVSTLGVLSLGLDRPPRSLDLHEG